MHKEDRLSPDPSLSQRSHQDDTRTSSEDKSRFSAEESPQASVIPSLQELGLPTKLRNSLKRFAIFSVEDLQWAASSQDYNIGEIRGIGKRGLEQISDALELFEHIKRQSKPPKIPGTMSASDEFSDPA